MACFIFKFAYVCIILASFSLNFLMKYDTKNVILKKIFLDFSAKGCHNTRNVVVTIMLKLNSFGYVYPDGKSATYLYCFSSSFEARKSITVNPFSQPFFCVSFLMFSNLTIDFFTSCLTISQFFFWFFYRYYPKRDTHCNLFGHKQAQQQNDGCRKRLLHSHQCSVGFRAPVRSQPQS